MAPSWFDYGIFKSVNYSSSKSGVCIIPNRFYGDELFFICVLSGDTEASSGTINYHFTDSFCMISGSITVPPAQSQSSGVRYTTTPSVARTNISNISNAGYYPRNYFYDNLKLRYLAPSTTNPAIVLNTESGTDFIKITASTSMGGYVPDFVIML